MKLNKIFSAFMLIAAVAFTACETPEPPVGPQGPGNGNNGGDTTSTVPPTEQGAGTLENPYTVNDVLTLNNTKTGNYWVKAYIVGQINGKSIDDAEFDAPFTPSSDDNGKQYTYNTNILIAGSSDVLDTKQCVVVQLPSGSLRSGLNLPENPDMDNQEILIYGSLEKYYGVAGIKSATYAKVGDKEFGVKPGETPDLGEVTGEGTREKPYLLSDLAVLGSPATKAWVKAYIVGQVKGGANKLDATTAEFAAPFTANDNGTNTNILLGATASVTSVDNATPLQLPSGDLRTALNLIQNESMLGKEILIYGSLEKYFGADGIKSPEYAEVGEQKIGIDPDVEQTEPQAKVVTIQEFIDAPESKEVYYELTGTIGGTINTTFGNFDLTDETATVYVYGLTKSFIAVGSTQNDKSYASLGLKEGDKITLRGFRGSYNGKIEVMGAYFVKKH